jgi:hypothetical protein
MACASLSMTQGPAMSSSGATAADGQAGEFDRPHAAHPITEAAWLASACFRW